LGTTVTGIGLTYAVEFYWVTKVFLTLGIALLFALWYFKKGRAFIADIRQYQVTTTK
jgi:hypothetical protein